MCVFDSSSHREDEASGLANSPYFRHHREDAMVYFQGMILA